MTSLRVLTAPAPSSSSSRAAITANELRKAARLVRQDSFDGSERALLQRDTNVAARRIRDEDFKKLRALCAQYGAVQDVDVQALIETSSRNAATNLERLYASVQAQKARGVLKSPWRTETITDEVVQTLARSASTNELTPRVVRNVQKTARLELLKLFADPVRDRDLHTLVVDDLKRSFRVDGRTIRAHEIPPDVTLREANARKQNALLALLFDASLSTDLKREVVQKLALCAQPSSIETLESFAKAEPALANDVAVAIDAIKKAARLTIVLASMEVAPYAFAGGLGNVMAELPKALAKMGHRVIVLAPRHAIIDRNKLVDTGKRLTIAHPDGTEPAQILSDVVDGVEHYFIENGKYFSDNRNGLYGDMHGSYSDVAERYDFFGMAIPEAIKAVLGDVKPDVVQLNDAHTGPAAAHIKADPALAGVKTVMAIHNLGGAYQGRFGADKLPHMGFAKYGLAYSMGPAEFYGDVNFLKLGLMMTDASIAVSRAYMNEILEPANGEQLEGVLRMLAAEDRLWGNLNGIDTTSWNPSTDKALPATYSFADQSGKAVCKRELQRAHGLEERANTPVVGVVSRITDQKGIDDIVRTIERRMSAGEDVQFVVCGQGDPALCSQLADLARRFSSSVAFDGAFTKDKERKIIGGSDLFLMPSRFEPCGLPQMYAMRYLTVPVVRSVGGLDESVQEFDPISKEGNGFKSKDDVDGALGDALSWYRSADRSALIRNLALTDFSWEQSSAVEQVAFFRKVMNA